MDMKIVLIFVAFAVFHHVEAQLAKGVSCAEKKVVIDTHNKLRKQIANGQISGQPKASNMQKIVWDDALATLAQNYANKMTFQHNPNRKDSRWAVGENLFISYSTAAGPASNWTQAVYDWFNEYKSYTYKPLVSDPKTGHYTQVVWANTLYVGCGFSYYKANGWFNKLYVCDYGPAGNYLGQTPYKTGAGCETLCCSSQCGGSGYGKMC